MPFIVSYSNHTVWVSKENKEMFVTSLRHARIVTNHSYFFPIPLSYQVLEYTGKKISMTSPWCKGLIIRELFMPCKPALAVQGEYLVVMQLLPSCNSKYE